MQSINPIVIREFRLYEKVENNLSIFEEYGKLQKDFCNVRTFSENLRKCCNNFGNHYKFSENVRN